MSCRICNKKLNKVINYKKVALAGNFLNKNQIKNEKKYQLTLMVCANCKHLQIKEKIDPKILFPKNYFWQTVKTKSCTVFEEFVLSHVTTLGHFYKMTNSQNHDLKKFRATFLYTKTVQDVF